MSVLIHATAVAVGGDALVLRGPSGAGKSDLALRLIGMGGSALLPLDGDHPRWPPTADVRLVADDQVRLQRHGDALCVSAPSATRGLIEVRGVGIVRVPVVDAARVRLVIDLVAAADVPRMPPDADSVDMLGLPVPRLSLYGFEASAPFKCALALRDAIYAASRSSCP